MEKKQTTTSGMEWNTMIGLTDRLKRDGHHRDFLLITMGCYFGLRISDLLSIKWKDVMMQDELIVLESKTKKHRKITINDKVKEAIDFCSNELKLKNSFDEDDYILINRWGSKLTISYINKRLKDVFIKYNVKVQNASSHTLRKTFGKRIFESDDQSERSLIYLSEILGHSSIAITRRYIGITQEQIKNVYLNL